MASTFKKGDLVKLVTVVPEGPVQSIRMTDEGVVQYLVGWTDVEGVTHERWFDEEQLIGA
jgi:hypothetical protein